MKENKTAARPRVRWIAAICAAATAACLTVSVSAAGGFGVLIDRFFGGSPYVQEVLQTTVFHDEDGNVSIDVDEFISDGVFSYALVRYTALTDEGREWINSYDILNHTNYTPEEVKAMKKSPNFGLYADGTLSMWPIGSHDDMDEWKDENGMLMYELWIQSHYSGNFANGSETVPSLDTEDEKHFMLSLSVAKRDTAGDEVDIFYPMTNDTRYTSLNTAGIVKEKTLAIDPEPDSDKYYIPRSIRLSQLSMSINGSFTDDVNNNKPIGHDLEVPLSEVLSFGKNTYLVMRDGTQVYMSYDTQAYKINCENDPYSKYVLLAGRYKTADGSMWGYFDGNHYEVGDDGEIVKAGLHHDFERMLIDIDEVVGIQIEDHYYDLTE